jgi:hypothetical protein
VGLRKEPSPTELPLGFTIDPEPIQETLISWGGAPLLLQAFRSLGKGGDGLKCVPFHCLWSCHAIPPLLEYVHVEAHPQR